MDWSMLCRLHAAPTLLMTGVIWIIQAVHYPLMLRVGQPGFAAYEQEHCRRIGPIVLPTMCAEAVLASWLWLEAAPVQKAACTAGLGLLAAIWGSTFLLQVPCHRQLERGYDEAAIRRLVRTNWIRTVGWTLRAALAVLLLG